MADSVVPAGQVSDLIPFKPHPLNLAELESEEVNHCHVTQEGAVLLMSCGPRLHSFAVRTGSLNTTWRFGRSSPSDPVVGPWVYMKSGGRSYTIATLQGNEGAPHLLCVCHMETGKTVKAIRIPAPATFICLVDDGDGEDSLADCPAGFMRGCVAVATADAQVFLVDLCMGQEKYSSEEYPASLKFFEGASPLGSAHGAIFVFNEESFLENDPKALESSDDVDVTCLEYLPQLRCLAVGLSSGAIHLWSLLSGSMTLSMKKSPEPVVALMLQEPENDPRRWCYLWVISGAKGSQRPTCMATCAMFSLDFSKKTPLDGYRFSYEGLTSCHQVFECKLGPHMTDTGTVIEGSPGMTSRLISCRTMLQAEIFATGRCNISDFVQTTDRQHDLNLMLLSWELFQGTQSLGTYMVIFDINQWYQAQMPQTYRSRSGQLSPYLGIFSLKEAVRVHGTSKVLDVHVVPRSVTKFHSASVTVDQHHFPSALVCKCVCVTERGIVHVTFLGLQRQLFQNLQHWGPSCILNPKELYLRCSFLGLLSQDLPRASLDLFVPSMQEALLTMALDYRLKGFLLSCIKQWTYSQDEGDSKLTLPFFINWAWERVKSDKVNTDRICVPLFDCLGQELSQDSLQRLAFINKDLKVLQWLFKHCARVQPSAADSGTLDLHIEVVERIEQYVSVLLFLISCGVLPDRDEGSCGVAYPGTFLTKWYQVARRTSPLLIDSIMEAILDGAPAPWGGPYPAPTLQEALTGSFLMHGLPEWGPYALMLYLLLDLASALMESHPHVVEALKAFPTAFSMSNGLQWFVQGCWHLDHSLYEKGMDLLLEAWESPLGLSPLLEALKRPILRLLSMHNRPKLALRFIARVPFPAPHTDPELLSLNLDVLLADRRVREALCMVRRSGRPCDTKDFFERVISISKPEFGTGTLLRELLQYPLSHNEESLLEGMLQRSGDSRELAVLALHWLRAGRTRDATRVAVALRDSLNRGSKSQASGGNPMYAAVLALVQNFADLVPSVARSSSTFRRVPCQEVHLPSPVRILPKGTKVPSVAGQPSKLRFAVGSSTAALQTRQDTPHRNGRQNIMFQRQRVACPPASREDCSEPPCKTPKITGGIQSRRSNVTPTVLADALAVLHTPPVKRGSPVEGVLPHTPPPSILKLRPVGAPREDVVADSSPPPTPHVLPEGRCSTPDTTTRKLRFAITDSSSSEINSPAANLDLSSQRDIPASGSGTPCSEPQAPVDDQSRLSFVTADEESTNDSCSATELSGDDVHHPVPTEQNDAATSSREAPFSTTSSSPPREPAVLDTPLRLSSRSLTSSSAEDSHGGTNTKEQPKDLESSPEVIVDMIVKATVERRASVSEAENEEISSSEKSIIEIDLDSEDDQELPVAASTKETVTQVVGTFSATDARDSYGEASARSAFEADHGTPLVEGPEALPYIPGMPTSQDVFDVLHSAAVMPEAVPVPLYDKMTFSASLSEDYLVMTSVDPRTLSPVRSHMSAASPSRSPNRDEVTIVDDSSSEGTPLKDSEPFEKHTPPETSEAVVKRLFERDSGLSVEPPFASEQAAIDEATAVEDDAQPCSSSTGKEPNLADYIGGSGDHGQPVNQHHVLPPDSKVKSHEELGDHERSSPRPCSQSYDEAFDRSTPGTEISEDTVPPDSYAEPGLEDTGASNKDQEPTISTDESQVHSVLPSLDDWKRSALRCRSEEPSSHNTILTRLRPRHYSEASDDTVLGQGLIFAEVGPRSESSVSLPSSELGDVSEPDEKRGDGERLLDANASKSVARRRSSRLLDISARKASTPKVGEVPVEVPIPDDTDSGDHQQLESSDVHVPQLRPRRTPEPSVARTSERHEKDDLSHATESEANKVKKSLRSPSRKSVSQPQLHQSMHETIPEEQTEEGQQQARLTPRRNVRARSEELPSVTVKSAKRRSTTALAEDIKGDFEQASSKTVSSLQTSRRTRQSTDNVENVEKSALSVEKTEAVLKPARRTPSKQRSELSTEQIVVQKQEDASHKSARRTPSKTQEGTPARPDEPSARRSETVIEQSEDEKEGIHTSHRSTRRTPSKKQSGPQAETAPPTTRSKAVLEQIEDDKEKALPTPYSRKKLGVPSAEPTKRETRSTTPVSPTRRATPLKKDSPVAPAAPKRSSQQGVSSHSRSVTLESIVEDAASENVEASIESTAHALSRTPKRTLRRSVASRRSSILETIPEQPFSASQDIETEEEGATLQSDPPATTEETSGVRPSRARRASSSFQENQSSPEKRLLSRRGRRSGAISSELHGDVEEEAESVAERQPSKDPASRQTLTKRTPRKTGEQIATLVTAKRSQKKSLGTESAGETSEKITSEEKSEKTSPTRHSPRLGSRKRASPVAVSPKKSPVERPQKRKSEESSTMESQEESALPLETPENTELPSVSAEATERKKKGRSPATRIKGQKSIRTKVASPATADHSVELGATQASQGVSEDTFELSAPTYLGDKSAVIPPEAQSRIFIFSPPLTRHRSALLAEQTTDVFKRPEPKAEAEEQKPASRGFKLRAPVLSPPPPKSSSTQEAATKRRRSAATIMSTKLVNTSKRRSLRLPRTPRRSSTSPSSSHESPGSPWTVIRPQEKES